MSPSKYRPQRRLLNVAKIIRFVGCGLGSRLAKVSHRQQPLHLQEDTKFSSYTCNHNMTWRVRYVAVIRMKHAELIGLYSRSAGFKLLRGISLSSLSRLNLTTHVTLDVTPTPCGHGNVFGRFAYLFGLMNWWRLQSVCLRSVSRWNSFARRVRLFCLSSTCLTLSSRSPSSMGFRNSTSQFTRCKLNLPWGNIQQAKSINSSIFFWGAVTAG